MSEVVWLPEALEDTSRLLLLLEDQSPAAAFHMAKTILDGVALLRDCSQRGRPLNDGTNRQELYLPLGAGACALCFGTDVNTVAIIRVWHSREYRTKPGLTTK